ncbi:hypothetical protein DL93DRAFT_1899666 [Clavulina sp. PMI_390]|nr:hypothetical protein DL93DRAFT_1899666 [Clavulina sp. PMI_390]
MNEKPWLLLGPVWRCHGANIHKSPPNHVLLQLDRFLFIRFCTVISILPPPRRSLIPSRIPDLSAMITLVMKPPMCQASFSL